MKNLHKELKNGKYEFNDDGGLYLPKSNVNIGGTFNHWLNDDLSTMEHDPNIVVNQGLDYLLDAAMANGTVKPNWYVGIFKGNYTPTATTTAQDINTAATEVVATTDVVQTVRPAWTNAAVSGQSITNSANAAAYEANATITVYGAFLVSSSAMANGISTDRLLAASRFGAPRELIATDALNVTYTLNIADA